MRQVISTPAGPLQFECQIYDLELTLTRTRAVPRGVVEEWVSPGVIDSTFVRAELEPPPIGGGPPVDVLTAVVWTVTTHEQVGPFKFMAHLMDAEAQHHLHPNNGEALEAVTYDRFGLSLSIGTQDDEALGARAASKLPTRAGPPLPAAWAPALVVPWQGDYGARSDPRGISINLPPLPPGQHADIHIAAAWAAGRGGPATWFAVDTDPDQILMAVLGRAD